jgi:hypothetical protein
MELFTKLRGPVENLTAIEQEQPLFALEVINTISEALDWDKTITQVNQSKTSNVVSLLQVELLEIRVQSPQNIRPGSEVLQLS